MIKWKILCSLRLPVTNTCVHTMTSRSSRLSSHTPRPPSAPLSLVPSGEAVPWGWNRRREPWGVDTMRCLQHFIVVPFEELLGENDMKMIYPSPSKGFLLRYIHSVDEKSSEMSLPGNLIVSQPSFVAWVFGIYMDLLLCLSCSIARLGPTHLWHILGHRPSVGAALRVLTWFNYMTLGIEIISSFGYLLYCKLMDETMRLSNKSKSLGLVPCRSRFATLRSNMKIWPWDPFPGNWTMVVFKFTIRVSFSSICF